MSDKSRIQWTDATWNPVTGCTKVSQGCKHCYAEKVFPRAYANDVWLGDIELDDPTDHGRKRKFTDVRTHPDRLDQPLRWRKPRRVFVNSMSDLFHEDVPFEFIDHVFGVMALAKRHTFQVLTKRPRRMQDYLRCVVEEKDMQRWQSGADVVTACAELAVIDCKFPPPNIWLGVSVEDQETADERIPLLLDTPAAERFVSYEPALGPVDLKDYLWPGGATLADDPLARAMVYQAEADGMAWLCPAIDWIIVGGESGPGARPFDVQWARDTVGQCRAANVPVFVKQLGRRPRGWCALNGDTDNPVECQAWEASEHGHCGDECPYFRDRKGGDIDEWPADLRIREFP